MFVPLHIHSEYSLLESCIKIDALVKQARAFGYRALALTDHNTMAGLVEFYRCCQANGLKPILGIELDLAGLPGCEQIVLLAENNSGYQNLLILASASKPVDLQTLQRHTQGLIGLVNLQNNPDVQGDYQKLARLFAKNSLYLELQISSAEDRQRAKSLYQKLPPEVFAAGTRLSYLEPGQKQLLEVIRQEKIGSLPLLPPQQMAALYRDFPQAVDNTVLIAKRCSVKLEAETTYPKLPEPYDLTALVWEGAAKRYQRISPKVAERINYELDVITSMGLSDYFLIVWDIVRYAKAAKIPVGPGRGSAAGSIVAYCLGITKIDPIAHNLFFERFLNKKRRNLPDIDLDICHEKREQVINYIIQRFGRDRVAKIGTYGTYGYKGAVNEITKLYGSAEPELVQQLVGLKQYFSTHAAGVVITPKPITTYSGVNQVDGMWVTQLAMDDLEYLGVLKIDFLALRTLTILKDIEAVVQQQDPDFSLDLIPAADQRTFSLLEQGLTLGIFQLESRLFQELLPQVKPRSFQDLAALLALGRPGPLKQVPLYIRRREGVEPIQYLHPKLEPILSETYGLIVYQEQVMQVAHEIAGLSLEEADLLRTAMSKKDHQVMQELRTKFVAGCQANGLSFRAANELFLQIDRFADYAFNKAHSTAYALITWQAAYLKANYPVEFYTGLLRYTGTIDKLGEIYRECQLRGIRVLPPDIRFSEAAASLEAESLRIGFGNLKYFGEAQARKLVQERQNQEFTSIFDLFQRVDLHLNAKLALAYSGALDCFGDRRTVLGLIAKLERQTLKEQSDLDLLEKEKEMTGIYLSGHPAERWYGFLERLKPSLGAYAAGHIKNVSESGQGLTGLLEGEHQRWQFLLPKGSNLWHDLIEEDSLVALYGKSGKNQIIVDLVLPLKPMLLIKPKAETLVQLKNILLSSQGNTPVLFVFGQDLIQLIDPSLWISPEPKVVDSLIELVEFAHWIDPWQSRVFHANLEFTHGRQEMGGGN
jgi:DNA polymerase-3 subunit alpha